MKFNKENINSMITTFCRIVTTIFIACCVYCSFFWKNTRIFSVTDIFCILMIGFTSVLYLIPFYSQKERSKKALFILQIIYFLEINITSLIIGFWREWFSTQNILSVIFYETVIIFVYTVVMIVSYKIDDSKAKEMNEKLKARNGE